ncbi:hypothetical protein VIGAN_UM100800 [Vigna angularis var. angularis]|uniref:Uncharacterized protein n=1 Tax=Vigna angularis var. angularis TaxID=157739 RepID=A0A0S3REQ3_PHAAN|nr:hypothetical protein VIGAN_02183300 [Vigna angularis var. angularis]BAU03412.1 hypothetical protein VIGAN_UM100800 [Vigna angularis var. angularis]
MHTKLLDQDASASIDRELLLLPGCLDQACWTSSSPASCDSLLSWMCGCHSLLATSRMRGGHVASAPWATCCLLHPFPTLDQLLHHSSSFITAGSLFAAGHGDSWTPLSLLQGGCYVCVRMVSYCCVERWRRWTLLFFHAVMAMPSFRRRLLHG